MDKKVLTILAVMVLFAGLALAANAEEKDVKFGAHVKGPMLFDESWGTSKIAGVSYSDAEENGMGFFGSHMLMFFISKDISDKMSIEIVPDIANVSAGATPSLGKQIGQQRKSTGSTNTTSIKWFQAFVKMGVPQYKAEIRAGYINVPFTQDYGKDLFWHEEFNANKFTLYVGSWHDTGVEVYRNFELSGLKLSLPVSAYILNGTGGNSARDNNRNKTLMLHAEPAFSGKLAGLKTFVSYGFGTWGDTEWVSNYSTATPAAAKPGEESQKYFRYALGASYDYQKFSFRAEGGAGKYENYFNYKTTTQEDKGNSGYYVKVFYKVIPDKLTAMLDYSVANLETSASNNETYNTTTLGLQYELAEAMTFIVQFDMADWSNDQTGATQSSLDFNRLSIGVRTTF